MSTHKDTLVILSPAFAANESDSWLPAQEHFVRALNRNFPSLEVIILTFHFPVQEQREYKWFGNKVITFSSGMKGKIHSLILWKRAWSELKRLNRDHRLIGIFSFFCSECAFIGHYFARRHQLKHFIWVLGQDAKKENNQVRRIKPSADELVCISDSLVREFEKNHGIRPAHRIPIGVEDSTATDTSIERTIDLIGVGSLIPLKQYDLFLNVVEKVTRKIPGIKAVIYGDGPEEKRLNGLIASQGLQDIVMLGGRLTQPEIVQKMQQSRILLHPSSYEGLGAVCIEALSAGVHVISFVKPIDAVIDHWHHVADINEMAATAIALINDAATDHSSVLPFKVDDTARKIMQLFNYKEESTS